MKEKAIIVDLDGTLANIAERRKYLEGKKDWKSFNASVSTDTLNVWCREIMVRLKSEYKILLVSGRVDSLRKDTENWLKKYDVPYDELLMRKHNDFRSDDIIKFEIYDQKIRPRYDVLFVIDDRARVVKMWRREGLVCLQCDEGEF